MSGSESVRGRSPRSGSSRSGRFTQGRWIGSSRTCAATALVRLESKSRVGQPITRLRWVEAAGRDRLGMHRQVSSGWWSPSVIALRRCCAFALLTNLSACASFNFVPRDQLGRDVHHWFRKRRVIDYDQPEITRVES